MIDRTMALNKEAFATRSFDAAYHFLAAALHLAVDEKNERGLMEVEAAAIEQLAWLNEYCSSCNHSTISASTRGQESIFSMLARQANTRQMLLNKQQRQPE